MYKVAPVQTRLPFDFYPPPPILIGKHEATFHQFDCLAVFYHTKSVQQTALVLGLTSKGVSSHLRNFKTEKETDVNKISEGIHHFLDTCDQQTRNVLELHYRYLLVDKEFKEVLKQIAHRVGSKKPLCIFKNSLVNDGYISIKPLENYLTLAGVHVKKEEEEKERDQTFPLALSPLHNNPRKKHRIQT